MKPSSVGGADASVSDLVCFLSIAVRSSFDKDRQKCFSIYFPTVLGTFVLNSSLSFFSSLGLKCSAVQVGVSAPIGTGFCTLGYRSGCACCHAVKLPLLGLASGLFTSWARPKHSVRRPFQGSSFGEVSPPPFCLVLLANL